MLAPADDEVVGGHPVAVLSHAYWQTRLGADPNVLNEAIIVNGTTFTIVGVAPRGFRGTTLGVDPDVFVPLTMRGQVTPGFDAFENRRSYWVYVFGRLKPGTTIEQARAGINAVYQPIIREVEAPLNQGMSEQTMARSSPGRSRSRMGGAGRARSATRRGRRCSSSSRRRSSSC